METRDTGHMVSALQAAHRPGGKEPYAVAAGMQRNGLF